MLPEWIHLSKHMVQMGLVLTLLIGVFIARRAMLHVYFRKKGERIRDHFVVTITQVAYLMAGVLLFFMLLLLFRVNIREFLTSMSLVAAALALVFKDYVSNALNGMIFMFSDTFTVGDLVRIGNHKGRIEGINLLNVQLRTDNDELVLIANNLVLQLVTVNYSKGSYHTIMVEFSVPASRVAELEGLEAEIRRDVQLITGPLPGDADWLQVREIREGHAYCAWHLRMPRPDDVTEREVRQRVWKKIARFD
jgi:small-conductance mechanosensitive channel